MNPKIDIIYAQEKYFNSFYDALNAVAKEKIYLEMVKAPPFAQLVNFQLGLIEKNHPTYFALHNQKVIGWCDITINKNSRMQHRGSLGMGLLSNFRGKGLGSLILEKTLTHASEISLEKVELQVYSSNLNAIGLYKKFGFQQEGLIQNYRKLDNTYFDCITMFKFL